MSEELPEGWTIERLDEVVSTDSPIVYGIIQPGPEVADGVPFVRPSEMNAESIAVDRLHRCSREVADKYSRSVLQTDDVVLAIVGTIGKVAVVPPSLNGGNITQSAVRIRPSKSVSSGYLAHVLRSPQLRAQYDAAAFGNAVQRLNVADVRALKVPLAPLKQREKLVRTIDALRARSRRAKEALDEVPALLDRLRQSILASAFRGDLTADWRAANPDVEPASALLARIRVERRKRWEEAELAKLTAKGKAPKDAKWKSKYVEPEPVDESELPELPEGWCWASVDELVFGIEAGASFTCEERPPGRDEIGVAKVSAVSWGSYDEQASKTCLDVSRIEESYFIRPGDFLVSRANTIELVGAVVIVERVDRKVMLSDKILRLRLVDHAQTASWLLLMLRSPWGRRSIEDASTGNQLSMRNIGQEALRGVCIPLPPASEMTVASQLAASGLTASSLIGLQREDVSKTLVSLDSAILAAAFRGELT